MIRFIAAWLTVSLMSVALGTPRQDAKTVLGGVIDAVIFKSIGKTNYILAVRRPYVNGRRSVILLRGFAGSYTQIWQSVRDYGEFADDSILGFDIVDLNGDGIPEVYVADVTAGNSNGVETYTLIDISTRKIYTVEVAFQQTGSPGNIIVGETLNLPKSTQFKNYLENKVSKSERLKDTRNAASLAASQWFERYGAFLEQYPPVAPIPVKPISAPLSSGLCRIDGSVATKITFQNIEYRSYFKYGIMSFDFRNKTCYLIVIFPEGDMSESMKVLSGELYVKMIMTPRSIVWNPTKKTLRWMR